MSGLHLVCLGFDYCQHSSVEVGWGVLVSFWLLGCFWGCNVGFWGVDAAGAVGVREGESLVYFGWGWFLVISGVPTIGWFGVVWLDLWLLVVV